MALQRSGTLQAPSNPTDKPDLRSSGESEMPDITTSISRPPRASAQLLQQLLLLSSVICPGPGRIAQTQD